MLDQGVDDVVANAPPEAFPVSPSALRMASNVPANTLSPDVTS